MKAYEFIIRFLNSISPLSYVLIVCAIITFAMAVLLLIFSRNMWITNKKFKYFSIFFSLGPVQKWRLAACWMKFLVLIIYVVTFQKLQANHFAVFVILAIISVLSKRGILKLLSNIISNAVEGFGLYAINMICAYIYDAGSNAVYIAIYIAASLFIIVYGIYIFLNELNDISEERKLINE